MIDEEQAIAIARARAQERGWGFREPAWVTTRVSWRGRVTRYEVVTDPTMRGTAARFTIDAKSGSILEEGYIPR